MTIQYFFFILILLMTLVTLTHAQDNFVFEDVSGSIWHQYEIVGKDTIEIKMGTDSCTLPL